jgi:hypothetical protein
MQSIPAGDQEGGEDKQSGELYNRLWGQTRFTERQRRTVYR